MVGAGPGSAELRLPSAARLTGRDPLGAISALEPDLALPVSLGSSVVRIESPAPSVSEGQAVDLKCLVPSYLQPRVTWYKRGGALSAHHQVGTGGLESSRFALTFQHPARFGLGGSSVGQGLLLLRPSLPLSPLQITGHHLRILQATVADSGEYVCRVSEGSGNARVQEASLVITVYGSSQGEQKSFLPLGVGFEAGVCI